MLAPHDLVQREYMMAARTRVKELERTVERVETLIDNTVGDHISAMDLIKAIGKDS
jgi:hypothetical protein